MFVLQSRFPLTRMHLYSGVIPLQFDIKCFDIFKGWRIWGHWKWLFRSWAIKGSQLSCVWVFEQMMKKRASVEVNSDHFFSRLCLHQSRANLSKQLPCVASICQIMGLLLIMPSIIHSIRVSTAATWTFLYGRWGVPEVTLLPKRQEEICYGWMAGFACEFLQTCI